MNVSVMHVERLIKPVTSSISPTCQPKNVCTNSNVIHMHRLARVQINTPHALLYKLILYWPLVRALMRLNDPDHKHRPVPQLLAEEINVVGFLNSNRSWSGVCAAAAQTIGYGSRTNRKHIKYAVFCGINLWVCSAWKQFIVMVNWYRCFHLPREKEIEAGNDITSSLTSSNPDGELQES